LGLEYLGHFGTMISVSTAKANDIRAIFRREEI
jgi:hypothetical protein